jgi:hypothetical protein
MPLPLNMEGEKAKRKKKDSPGAPTNKWILAYETTSNF